MRFHQITKMNYYEIIIIMNELLYYVNIFSLNNNKIKLKLKISSLIKPK